jgi:hypothetical protein
MMQPIQQSSSTGSITIKAEGGSTCKTFTLKNINFYIYNSSNQSRSLKTMTMTIKNYSGTTIATHTFSGTYNTTNAQTLFSLTNIPFTTSFPSSGYTAVSEINFTYTCGNGAAGYSPSNLFFRSIDLEDISATAPTSTTWNGTSWSTTPTASLDAIIASSTVPSSSFTCKSLTINSGVALTTTGITASVNGNIVNNGNGIAGSGDLIINANSTISGNAISFNGALTVNTGATLTTGGLLTLSSNATSTARVANSAGTITGNVSVQRYLPAKRAWRFLTAPVVQTTPQSLNASWQTQVEIVGPSGSNLTLTTPFYNFLTFNSSTNAWVNVSNPATVNLTGSSLNNAFCAFIVGPPGTANNTSANVTTSATGSLLQGTKTFNYTAATNNYALVPNPYASPVDLNTVYLASSNINRTFYTWDPRLGGSSTTGGYVTISWNGTSYDIVGGTTDQTQIVQSGQAFFVQASAANPSIVFNENAKSSTNVNTVFGAGTGNTDKLTIGLQKHDGTGLVTINEVLSSYNNNYSKSVNYTDDAEKMWNSEENITIHRDGYNLTIERRPFIGASNDSIFLRLSSLRANTNYALSFTPSHWDAGSKAYLLDKLLNTETLIDLNASNFTHQFTSSVATANDRFVVVFRGATLPNKNFDVTGEKLSSTQARINWEATGEVGVKTYSLEKSADGISYQTINTQVAKNNNTISSYKYTDNDPVNGVNYYRVKITQQNDVERYSKTITINLKQSTQNVISVYPNPAKGQVNISTKDATEIRLINVEGKVLFSKTIKTTNASSIITNVDVSNFGKGVYMVEVVNKNGEKQVEKLVISQ